MPWYVQHLQPPCPGGVTHLWAPDRGVDSISVPRVEAGVGGWGGRGVWSTGVHTVMRVMMSGS